mgnify:CR=1 FL=1
MITDDALRAAAKEASLALAETLVQGSKQQPPYSPSKSFTRKMSRLCRRERHPVFHRTMQRVAAVFLHCSLPESAGLRLMPRPAPQQSHGLEAFHRAASYIAS